MNILSIGGSGTVGASTTKALVEYGHNVTLIDRNITGLSISGTRHIIMDYHNASYEDIHSVLGNQNFDIVIDYIGFQPDDVIKDFSFFRDKLKQYVFISTTMVYHRNHLHYRYNEQCELGNPFSKYAQGKIKCEKKLLEFYHNEKFPVTILRPTDTYDLRTVPISVQGDNGVWSVLKRILVGKEVIIHGDGTNRWTVTNSEDIANMTIPLLLNPEAIGKAIQVTSTEHFSWTDIFESIADALQRPLKPCYIASQTLAKCGLAYDLEDALLGDAANNSIFDNSLFMQLVPCYKQKIYFREGVKQSINHILSNPQLQVEDEEFDNWCDKLISYNMHFSEGLTL